MQEGQQALFGDVDHAPSMKRKADRISALDELFRETLAYRRSPAYFDLLNFINRFPSYAPFNCFLLHMQRPTISYVATRIQWKLRFDRTVKDDAHPLVILAHMGPVVFVYDLADTEGDELPQELERPYATSGEHVPETVWSNTRLNCAERDQVALVEKNFSPLQAGVAKPNDCRLKVGSQQVLAKRLVELNRNHSRDEQYVTLAHELAHIHCGHTGGDPQDGWWPDRSGLGRQRSEFEAESVSYLVCSRLRMNTTAAEYLAWYTTFNETIPDISLETVLKVAGYIESLGQKELGPRKMRAKAAQRVTRREPDQ